MKICNRCEGLIKERILCGILFDLVVILCLGDIIIFDDINFI